MGDNRDLELTIQSHIPLLVIESHEEMRVLELLRELCFKRGLRCGVWTVTEGFQPEQQQYTQRQLHKEPEAILRHIKSTQMDGVYVLVDFHPYLEEPVHVRLLKEIALAHREQKKTIVLLSPHLNIPSELKSMSAQIQLEMPSTKTLEKIVADTASEWSKTNAGKQVKTDKRSLSLLIRNLSGLTATDAKRLAKNAIYDDGAITQSDVEEVMRAKYELLSRDGVLAFEYDTASFADVAGLFALKTWLEQRKSIFLDDDSSVLDPPKGVLLLGVQGCGKSLAAKAVAGLWGVPLLRLDFGAVYNKFIGETERNLRDSLKVAEVMAPCVLWFDEIEKGLSANEHDGGTSRRILGTLLTWMADKGKSVFVVATANDIERLPPELVRKGRFDEIFFVDLPSGETRKAVFEIHLAKRKVAIETIDLGRLVELTEGFSGAEIEQAVVSALYSAKASESLVETAHLVAEVSRTKPLAVVMKEKIEELQRWAAGRTVSAD